MPRILIQVGHETPREPGFETGTGAGGEVEVNRKLGAALERKLKADPRFTVRVIPGRFPDDVKNGSWKVDAFISLHCDGSGDPATSFFSFGYPPGFRVNRRLANLIAKRFEEIPHRAPRGRDNYTTNLSRYHGWSRVPTSGPEVLVEHDFVSNPKAREWLHAHVDDLAEAEYLALLDFFELPRWGQPEPKERVRFRLVGPNGQTIHTSGVAEKGNVAAEDDRLERFLETTFERMAKRLRAGDRVEIVREDA